MPNKSENRLLVEDYCERFKDEKDYTLAKKIFTENEGFRSIEQVRDFIRYIRGHHGKYKRKSANMPKPLNYETSNSKPKQINSSAKVLILDIETAPIMAYVWGLWKQNVYINQIHSDWFIFTWAAKWLFEEKTYSGKLTSKEAIAHDDKRIMQSLWAMLNEADIVITHNGDKFDIPKINTRFLMHGMNPPMPYLTIDTLKVVKGQFKFSSNKQELLNITLGSDRKVDTGGFELWEKCYKGDKESLNLMEEYNIGDIISLESNYLKLRPFIKPHPNMGLFILDGHERCPSCGSDDLQAHGKDYLTTVNIFEALRCNNCGAIGRRRKSKLTVNERRNVLSSSPR